MPIVCPECVDGVRCVDQLDVDEFEYARCNCIGGFVACCGCLTTPAEPGFSNDDPLCVECATRLHAEDLYRDARAAAEKAWSEHWTHVQRHNCQDWKTGRQCADGEALTDGWYHASLFANAIGFFLGIERELRGHNAILWGLYCDAPLRSLVEAKPRPHWGNA